MLNLREMTAGEYDGYRRFFIEEYARDLSGNHGYGIEKGRVNATRSINGYLPQGVDTPGHQLYCIELAGDGRAAAVIGYLWVGWQGNTAFISDFCILDAWRRRGYGKAALALLDSRLSARGITELGLRVAADNPGARALYDRSGFRVTGVNMAKRIG
ncbi:GNAT family N-acetyltransferase [Sodalis sp. RH21]|uniref:GNAT family N-acetyltransferase n=1 Tax=unclassified Sodalis (in: enterobacteria) TaxID=2636512 RepID=UPI0039B3866C